MREKQVSVAEKMAMVSLASSDWQQSNDPDNDELFQTLISLIKLGHVVAFMTTTMVASNINQIK